MSRENVEVVRGLLAAPESEDGEAALGLLDPAVEWSVASQRDSTRWGPEGVVNSLAEWLEPWETAPH
jgi:ketosteroid isomerase-like protein